MSKSHVVADLYMTPGGAKMAPSERTAEKYKTTDANASRRALGLPEFDPASAVPLAQEDAQAKPQLLSILDDAMSNGEKVPGLNIERAADRPVSADQFHLPVGSVYMHCPNPRCKDSHGRPWGAFYNIMLDGVTRHICTNCGTMVNDRSIMLNQKFVVAQ